MTSLAPAWCSFCAIDQAILRLLATPKTTEVLPCIEIIRFLVKPIRITAWRYLFRLRNKKPSGSPYRESLWLNPTYGRRIPRNAIAPSQRRQGRTAEPSGLHHRREWFRQGIGRARDP